MSFFPKKIIEWIKGNAVDATMLQPSYVKMLAKNDYGDKVNDNPRPRPLDVERAAHARRWHDGVCGVRSGAGAYEAGGEDDGGVI